MGYHINLFKNKFKRLKIEVHHNKNKISSKEHVIKNRDPSKPLITLRTTETAAAIGPVELEETIEDDYDEEEEEMEHDSIDQSEFIGFSDASKENENEKENYNTTALGSTVKSYISMYNKIRSGQSSLTLEIKRQQCKCTCHQDTESTLRNPIYHIQHCLSFCETSNYTPPTVNEVSKNVVDHVNYIEPKSSPRRGFWIFKRKHPLAKLPEQPTLIERAQTETDSVTSAAERIEIIAQSSIEPSPVLEEKENHELENQTNNDNSAAKLTSYARRNAKSGVSLLNFSRTNSGYVKERSSPTSKHNSKSNEPWRMVMNDISLHAALLSTGSKPILSRSSLNLAADFTSSKHNSNQRPFTNDSVHSELISFRSIPAVQQPEKKQTYQRYQYHELQIMDHENHLPSTLFQNDENDDFNGMEKNSIGEATKRPHHVLDSRPSTETNKSKISLISGTLERDPFKGAETSAVYGGVFQDYNYSDESVEGWKDVKLTSETALIKKEGLGHDANDISSEVLPLKISSRGINQIF